AAADAACRFLWDLRRAGLSADRDYTGRTLGNQLKQADRLGARWAVVLGESEIAEESATVKEMSTGQQIKVPFRELVAHLSSRERSAVSSWFSAES
ncbi:MAG: hypothetical protein HYU64_18520, partial [Armatimonadetes bacterium]|nr:hypothetical protein [Armatimonadota bacterium]